jgi:hypothetical protein
MYEKAGLGCRGREEKRHYPALEIAYCIITAPDEI